MDQREILERAIKRIEEHRHLLDSDVVRLSVAALQQKLAASHYSERELSSSLPDSAADQSYQPYYLTVLAASLPENESQAKARLPEQVDQVWSASEQIIQRWGGVVAPDQTDKLVAFFGVNGDKDDASQRAVRAALAIQAELLLDPHLKPGASPAGLKMQVGLHRGPIMDYSTGYNSGHAVAQKSKDRYPVPDLAGKTVYLAERLKEMAPVSAPLMSYEMYRTVGHLFEVEPLVLPDLKQESTQLTDLQTVAYLVTDDKTPDFWQHLRSNSHLRSNGIIPHLIGREAEYELLQQQLERVVEQRQAHLVTVVGGLGMGKSHLLYHFEQWLNLTPVSVRLLRGRVGAKRWQWPTPPLGDIVAELLDLRLYDSELVLRHKIRRGLQRYLPETAVTDRGRRDRGQECMALVLENWLGLATEETVNYSPAHWLMVLVRLLKAVVGYEESGVRAGDTATRQTGPAEAVVLLLEDLHEADEASINFIEALFRQCCDIPLLLIGSARPSLRAKRPSWPTDVATGQHSLLPLIALSPIDTRHLINLFLPHYSPPPLKLYELLAAGARGTPLYIREGIRLLQLEGRLEPGEPLWSLSHLDDLDDTWRSYIDLPERRITTFKPLPNLLPHLFQSQLNALSPIALSVLRQAAAVGYLFWDKAIAYLGHQADDQMVPNGNHEDSGRGQFELTAVLQALVTCGLIQRYAFPIYRYGRAYTFSHPLLRRILYEQISPTQRQYYQQKIVEWQQQYRPHYYIESQSPVSAAKPMTTRQQPIQEALVDRPLRNRA